MNIKRIIAGALACAVLGGAIPAVYESFSIPLTSNAAEIIDSGAVGSTFITI